MFGRRIAILVAVLMGLTALAASVAPPPQPDRRAATRTPTPTPTEPPATAATGGGTVNLRLEVGSPGAPLAHVRARVGETVMLEVSGDVVDSVVVEHFPAIEPIDPSTPAELQLEPTTPGSFTVRLVDHDRDVGVLDVSG